MSQPTHNAIREALENCLSEAVDGFYDPDSPLNTAIIREALDTGGAESPRSPRPVADGLFQLARDIEDMAERVVALAMAETS